VRGKTPLTGYFPCYAVYETRDGHHVMVGAYEEHFRATLCRHFGREDFIQQQWDEGAKREEMFAFFRVAFRAKTLAEWVAALADVEICFAPVATLEEAFADPQVRYRRMVVEHGRDAHARHPDQALRDSGLTQNSAAQIRRAHRERTGRSRFRADEIARFRRDGVV